MAAFRKPVSVPELRKSEDVKPGIKKTPIHYPFWFGGSASCFATFFTHPLDLGELFTVLHVTLEAWLIP
jgi:dicarboxylate transporter 10